MIIGGFHNFTDTHSPCDSFRFPSRCRRTLLRIELRNLDVNFEIINDTLNILIRYRKRATKYRKIAATTRNVR